MEASVVKTLSLSEASKRAKRSIVWMRRLADEGRIKGTKIEGEWALDVASIDEYVEEVQTRENQRLQKIEEGYKYPYTRPRVQAVKMIRAALTELHIADADAAVVLRFWPPSRRPGPPSTIKSIAASQ